MAQISMSWLPLYHHPRPAAFEIRYPRPAYATPEAHADRCGVLATASNPGRGDGFRADGLAESQGSVPAGDGGEQRVEHAEHRAAVDGCGEAGEPAIRQP